MAEYVTTDGVGAPDYDRALLHRMLANEADMAFKRRAEAVFDFLDIRAGDRVLDMGCGRGFFLNLMGHLFPGAAVTGVELDRPLLPRARAHVPGAQVVNGTVYRLPFADGSFDKVVFTEVIEHIPDDAAALRELYRVLAPGGVMGLTTPHANYPFLWDPINKALEITMGRHIQTGPLAGIWANHVRLYTVEGLAQLAAGAGFVVEDTRYLLHHCFPFIHNLVYGIGKPLLERGLLPPAVADAADRYSTDGGRGGQMNPVRLGLALFNAVDALNDVDPPTPDRSFLLIAMKLRKPEAGQP
jgi:SAM-dependent methyltransferase